MTTKKTVVSDQRSEIRDLPLDVLSLSPEETRKTIDQAALAELAKSIELQGIIEPLLVRPVDGRLEIVAGQRRWLASKLASQKTCRCVVQEMTDEEACEKRITSNLQREDLPPMEEAEGFGKLLARPGATIETIASVLAKTPSYVGRRLKLLDAIEPVRAALKAGAIEVGHALELARLSERQQGELLEWLGIGYKAAREEDDDGGDSRRVDVDAPGECSYCGDNEEDLQASGRTWLNVERTVCSAPDCEQDAREDGAIVGFGATRSSVTELRRRIARDELRVLNNVPFPLDAEIAPMACTVCPKRASGAASLFADIADDTCTDPECLNSKLKIWVKAQLEGADREKRKLLMLYDGHAGHAQDRAGVSRWDCKENAACASAEQAIWVSGLRIGHLISICRDRKCAEHYYGVSASEPKPSGGATRSGLGAKQSPDEKRRQAAQAAERAKLAAKVKAERDYREKIFSLIASVKVPNQEIADRLTKTACLSMLAQAGQQPHLAKALGWDLEDFRYGNQAALEKRLRTLDVRSCLHAAALALCATDVVVGEYAVSQGAKAQRLEEVAGLFGIDVAEIRSPKKAKPVKKPAAPKVQPKAAKPAAKPAPKKAAKAKKPAAKKAAKKAVRK